MKKLLLSCALIAAVGSISAQNYYFLSKTGVDAGYNQLSTAGIPILDKPSNDALSGANNIPFSWSFYGQAVTQYKVSDNGYVTFDMTETTSKNTPTALPDVTAPKSAIFALWSDLQCIQNTTYTGERSQVFCTTYGSSPNRTHVIQWYGVSKVGTNPDGNNILFVAIRLFEAGGFDIVYPGHSGTFAGTIGCQNTDGTLAAMVGGPTTAMPDNGFLVSDNKDVPRFVFNFGTQLDPNMSILKLDMLKFYGKNTDITVTGSAVNYGSNPVTTMTLNYSVNGGAAVSQALTGLNIAANGGIYAFNHSTGYNTPDNGLKNVKVWIDNINGAGDADHSDDSATASFTVIDKTVPRSILNEVFTSSTCPPCNPGNANFHSIMDSIPKTQYTTIKYQQDFPGTGDPYTTTETLSRRNYYAINTIPRMEVDGGWDGNANSWTYDLYKSFKKVPAVMDIEATHTVNWRTVAVNVTVKPYMNIPSGSKLYVVVNEKTTDKNVKTNGETEFYNVAKKMIDNQNGTNMGAITANTNMQFAKSTTFNGIYRLPADGQTANIISLANEYTIEEFNDLEVVVFVQNGTTKEVYQSAWSAGTFVGLSPIVNKVNLKSMYPNPVSDAASLEFNLERTGNVTLEVVDLMGKVVMSENQGSMNSGDHTLKINTADFSNGVYFLNVKTADGSATQKFVVAK